MIVSNNCQINKLHVYYSPDQMGLLDPSTSDGRVIFFLPWQKQTIAGTTDLPCEITHHPKPTEDEIMFILHEIKSYLNPDVEGIDFNCSKTITLIPVSTQLDNTIICSEYEEFHITCIIKLE